MFRNFKSGGYSLEGSKLGAESLTKLIIVIAIAYTSATEAGRVIKKMGIQKYVVRPETKSKYGRRHSGATPVGFPDHGNAHRLLFMLVNISIIGCA